MQVDTIGMVGNSETGSLSMHTEQVACRTALLLAPEQAMPRDTIWPVDMRTAPVIDPGNGRFREVQEAS